MSSQTQALQKHVEQLRQEANIKRITVSQAVDDLVSYMNENAASDYLVVGLIQSDNPFRDQKSCTIL